MTRQRTVPSAVSAAVLLLWLAATRCDIVVPRQGWSERWGPLVPHHTFPGDCGICHTPDRWDVLREDFQFDHEAETGYALVGAHAAAACLRCHNDRGPVAVYAARGCGGCHPDPHKGSLGLRCDRCHDQVSWRPGGLIAEHARTRFPLAGAHAVAPCEGCHPRAPVGDFAGAPVDCEVCHQRALARARSPDHLASGWTNDCERCHTPLAWERARVEHDFFPLRGGHDGLDCARCHGTGTIGPLSPDCYGCHRADYERAPDHVAQGFSTDCTRCHSIYRWEEALVNHDFFPLTGGHAGLRCNRCHTSGTFGPIPADCYSCHRSDYEGAPDHASLGFSTDCTRCHTIAGWTPASFSHTFPLRGPHDVSCSTCHQGGQTRTFTCLVCHEHSRSRMDDKHREVGGYRYDSTACFGCHPGGKAD